MIEKPEGVYICYWRNMAYESRLNTTHSSRDFKLGIQVRLLDCVEQIPVYFMV
jgi:hypothetical protein